MNLSFDFLQQLRAPWEVASGFFIKQFERTLAQITAGYNVQHNADDTHGTITASGSISERGRSVAIGDWTDQAFSASDFSAVSPSLVWTVTSATLSHFRYMYVGSTLFVDFRIIASALSGTTNTTLTIALPNLAQAAKEANAAMRFNNVSASGCGEIRAGAGLTYLLLTKADGTNWDISNTLDVAGQIALPVVVGTGLTGSRTIQVDYLLVGGGGGGADGTNGANQGGGGGGGGDLVTGTDTVAPGQYAVVIGAGGAKGGASSHGSTGGASTFNGHSAAGGGGGSGGAGGTPTTGGSGGGSGDFNGVTQVGASGTGTNVHSGGNNGTSGGTGGSGGGGGGAGGAGANGAAAGVSNPAGGVGLANSLSGASVTYAAGGAGGAYTGGAAGTAGGANTGNGGGGGQGGATTNVGAAGGSGIVIIRYAGTPSATGGTITQSGGYTIHSFTANGTFSI